MTNLEKVQLYLKSLEDGKFGEVGDLFAPDVRMEQLPNRIYPQGLQAGLAQMKAASEKGRKLLSSQRYEIKKQVVNGDSVAIEVLWTGKLAIAFGNLAAGAEMRCHSAMFFEFAAGKIVSQRNYDCFEPW
jgi:ketosteroid isomerase-like protein